MKSLITAIVNRFRTGTNSVAKSLSDPYEDGKLAIADQEKQIDQFVERIATFTASVNKTKAERNKELENVSKYENIAKQALEQSNKEDATEAVEMKLASQAIAENLTAEIQRNESILEKLRAQLSTNKSKVREAKRRLEMLKARQEGVEMRKSMIQANGGLMSQNTGLGQLEIFADDVETEEFKVEALEDITEEDTTLEEKYSTTSEDVQKELDRLMKNQKRRKSTTKKK